MMGKSILWILVSLSITNCSLNSYVAIDKLTKADTTTIIQECLNSNDLKTLFKTYQDSTLKVFMNGYIAQEYSATWEGKPVIYISPYRNKYCFNDGFILQVTRLKVESAKAQISFWLQRQGSGADFEFSKIKDRWVIDTANTFLY